MHDHKPSRTDKQLTHLGKPDLITRKNEYVHDDLPRYHSLHEGVIVLFSTCEVVDILAFVQLFGRTHLLLEVGRDGGPWAYRAGVSHHVDHSRLYS